MPPQLRSPAARHPLVRAQPPPRALMRVLNPIVRRVLRGRLGRRTTKIGVVDVRGRRSGRTLRIPMGLHDLDGVPTAFTCRGWRWNFASSAPVTVVRGGARLEGHGTLVDAEPGQVGAALRQALSQGASAFDLGLHIDAGHVPTIEELDASGLHMIRFDLAPVA